MAIRSVGQSAISFAPSVNGRERFVTLRHVRLTRSPAITFEITDGAAQRSKILNYSTIALRRLANRSRSLRPIIRRTLAKYSLDGQSGN